MSDLPSPPFRRVLVANRGEIALRVFHTCHELGIDTVGVYSEADADSPHRYAADEAILIGRAPAAESYLQIDTILEAAERTGADAIHPGYGFLSENPAFARAVEDSGRAFIGPTPEQIEAMGDKLRSREIFKSAGVPVIPGTEAAIGRKEDLEGVVDEIGYPFLIKAAAGGGGKGIRRVDSEKDLASAWERSTSEAGAAFGDRRVYLERLVNPARHVEAQIFGDGRGNAVFLGERECSLQRHHQKLLEETPSPSISEEVREEMRKAALAGVRAIEYRGAGTIEFLYDDGRGEFYFLEMNTRLQVEHPVTEMVTGHDLVAEQLAVAAGKQLADGWEAPRRGWSMEYRVYAEDPYRGFLPSTGTIEALRLPHVPFTRIDAALREGYEVSPYYDPLLCKMISWGETRREAIRRLERLLVRTRIGGLHTTVPLGIEICRTDAFQAGEFHTRSLEEWLDRSHLPTEPPAQAICLAAIIARHALSREPSAGQPEEPPDGGRWGWAARLEGTGRSR